MKTHPLQCPFVAVDAAVALDKDRRGGPGGGHQQLTPAGLITALSGARLLRGWNLSEGRGSLQAFRSIEWRRDRKGRPDNKRDGDEGDLAFALTRRQVGEVASRVSTQIAVVTHDKDPVFGNHHFESDRRTA